ncbi:redox-sensitive bicupin YhaK (pirin superfamily) [Azospirillum agricola]|uniref:pirin family protein n=1 Tax=Azospirillum agricola TaxID=1720247 RepID=UPI001AE4DCC4|nr:pirin family protein [Azospirillum agricola]MBP2231039.1 redox-sensitive bicupin YhaK (pirin superfamily) [Azospirillum agricola]
MITIRHRDERGVANMGWLNSSHSFSFGHYHDPRQMGFRSLRVINEDRVIPGAGFPTHGHANMEIVSYVLDGALEHKDSIGTGSIIRPGEVQRMSAGRGIRHSEYNASQEKSVHFLQIWILPEAQGLAPSYEQKAYPEAEKRGKLRLVGSRDGRDGSVTIHQDIDLHAALLDGDESASLEIRPGRHAWVQVARGQVHVNGTLLKEGDGAAFSNEPVVTLDKADLAEVLVFDLA